MDMVDKRRTSAGVKVADCAPDPTPPVDDDPTLDELDDGLVPPPDAAKLRGSVAYACACDRFFCI